MAKWLSMVAALLAMPVVFAFPAPNGATIIKSRSDLLSTYDYIIVGGGTSGLVVANRLSENPKINVLVIEAGKLDPMQDDILVPRLVNQAANFAPGGNVWDITPTPLSAMNGRTHPVYAGKLVGGGSAINGMAFDRGAKGDYDAWETLGNSGWNWNNLLPYFKKSETYTPPTAAQVAEFGIQSDMSAHGTSGPIKSSYGFLYPNNKEVFKAMKEMGIPQPKDGANGEAIGTFWVPASLDKVNGTRSYARTGYYEPAKARPNYHLLTENQVTKILTTKSGVFGLKRKATGVQYAKSASDSLKTISASREVIVAGGALHTPVILKLSGIGPKKQLEALGIESVIDLPGVGENLQDHPAMFTGAMLASPPAGGSLDDLNDPVKNASAWEEYRTSKTGPITISQGNVLSFIPLKQITDVISVAKIVTKGFLQPARAYLRDGVDITVAAGYALQKSVLLSMLSSDKAACVEVAGGIGGGALSIQKTFSRGFVDLKSKNPFDMPIIDHRAFTNPLDFDVMVESFKFWRRLGQTNTAKALGQVEVFPGPDTKTDEDIKEFIRNTAWPSFAHYSGTAMMLKRVLGGVVDEKLMVYSTTNLRVVDASIMPLVPSTHIQSTVYAVAERAADIIKAAQ